MKRYGRRLLFAAGASLLTLAAYAGAGQAADLKIGVLTPLSGTFEPIGQQVKWGMELALREINGAGGIAGRHVTLVYEDSEGNPSVATQKAEKLFQHDNVDVLTGTVNSGATLAVGQVAERNKRLLVTSVSVSDAITGAKCSPNVFRVNAPGGMQATALAAWVESSKPGARVELVGPDYEMGHNMVAGFAARAKGQGLKVVGEVFPPLGEKDFSPFFGQIRQARPDVLYVSTAGNDSVRLLSQIQEYGLRQQLMLVGSSVAVTAQNIKAIGAPAEGFVSVSGYSPDIDSAANRKFVKDFRAETNTDPDLYGADSYGFLYLYKAAVEKAGSSDTDAVRKAMEGISWMTPQGEKMMRAGDHQTQMDMYVLKVQNGRFGILEKVPGEKAMGPDECKRF